MSITGTLKTPRPAKAQIADLLSNPDSHFSSLAELGRAVSPPVSRERARVVVRLLGLSLHRRPIRPPSVCQSCGIGVKRPATHCKACLVRQRFHESYIALTCAGCGVVKMVLKSYARSLEKRGHKRFYCTRACFLAHGGKPPSDSVASMQIIKPGEARRVDHHDVSCRSRLQKKGSGYTCTLARAFYKTGWRGAVHHEEEHVAVVVRFPD